ncbi:MAG: hypothetical protein FWF99_04510 [Desulfovibrionaceae bacterium]|nr:hypothetical protein [Desulfovibrionaceae bacterium]
MTRFFIPLALFCLFLSSAACQDGRNAGESRLAVINTDGVFQQSKLAQKGVIFITSQRAILDEELARIQGEITNNAGNQELEKRLRTEMIQMEQAFDLIQMETATRINDLFAQILEEYRQRRNLEMILPMQVVLSHQPGADITSEIAALMDQQNLEFSPPSKGTDPADPGASPESK